jgi:hypothetical protein
LSGLPPRLSPQFADHIHRDWDQHERARRSDHRRQTPPVPVPADMARLRDKLLADSGFVDIEKPKHSGRPGEHTRRMAASNAEYFAHAASRLSDYRCDEFSRQILDLHVGGMKNRPIALKLRTYRRLVDSRVNRFKAWLRGERGKGRPPVEGGKGDGCVRITVRLDDVAASALAALVEGLQVSDVDAVRLALRAQARVISGAGK